MSTVPAQQNQQVAPPNTAKSLFERDDIKKKFQELLGKNSSAFMTAVLQLVSASEKLKSADPVSIYQSAAMAATLNLNINPNLGYAYIIPYDISYQDGGVWKKKTVAQFQIGYKGFIQLAQRSGQFKGIAAAPIFEGQLVEQNPLTGFVFDFSKKKSEKIIGFASYFQLVNGFEKTLFMTVEELKSHGLKYSQTYKNEKTSKTSKWATDFEAMACKTVLKLLLTKYAPLSTEMQNAQLADQSVINDVDTMDVEYADNTPIAIDESQAHVETARVLDMISKADSPLDIEMLLPFCTTEETKSALDQKSAELNAASQTK
jgi:recombination protein RecT